MELSTRHDISLKEDIDGVLIIVQHPVRNLDNFWCFYDLNAIFKDQWPNNAFFVPPGSQTAVVIKPTFSYTTHDVRRLLPEQRQCLNVKPNMQTDFFKNHYEIFILLGRRIEKISNTPWSKIFTNELH